MEPGKTERKVLIAYDSMWGNTEAMAKAILKGLTKRGFTPGSSVLRQITGAISLRKCLKQEESFSGSPTLNNGMFPTMGDFLTYLKGLRPKGGLWPLWLLRVGGGAIKEMRRHLEAEKFEIWDKELSSQFFSDSEDLKKELNLDGNLPRRSFDIQWEMADLKPGMIDVQQTR